MASSIDLHPPVHWGQTTHNVSLRIGLTDVKYPTIDISTSSVKFQATGCSGSRGEQLYSFEIELYDEVDAQASSYKINDREISVTLKKRKEDTNNAWPRLTKTSSKLPWLKTDFDKMKFSEDESEDELKAMMKKNNFDDSTFQKSSALPSSRRNKQEDVHPNFINELLNNFDDRTHLFNIVLLNSDDIEREICSMNIPFLWSSLFFKGSLDNRTYWLLFYNLLQFMGYFLVITRLVFHLAYRGQLENSYRIVENPMKLCQSLSVLEIIHPLIGFTKGGWVSPLMQFSGRNLVLFMVINYNNDIKSSPLVAYLFFVWSFVELFRYPYYFIHLLKNNSRFITWCRYTLWIILYPLGAFLEGLVIFNSLAYYRLHRHFTFELPNKINFSFHFALFLQIYLFILPLGLLYMMKHMWSQRRKTLTLKKNE